MFAYIILMSHVDTSKPVFETHVTPNGYVTLADAMIDVENFIDEQFVKSEDGMNYTKVVSNEETFTLHIVTVTL